MVRGLREPHLLVRETMERRKAFDGKNNTAIFFKPPHVPIGCVFFLGDDRRPQPYFETWVAAHKTFLVSGKKIKNRSPIEPMFFPCHTAPHGTAQRQKRLVLALDSRKDTHTASSTARPMERCFLCTSPGDLMRPICRMHRTHRTHTLSMPRNRGDKWDGAHNHKSDVSERAVGRWQRRGNGTKKRSSPCEKHHLDQNGARA